MTADGWWEWARTLGRSVIGDVGASPFVQTTTGRSFEVRLNEPLPYQLDGGDRKPTKKLKIKVKPERDHRGRSRGGRTMSTANPVPETFGLTGSDAKETLEKTGRMRLLRDAFERLRASDGFSHARSMAFVTSLILVQGVIALVGLASVLGSGRVSDAIVGMLKEVFPGPAGVVLTDAVKQAHEAGAQHRSLALTLGLIGAIVTGTTLLGQIERAMNRLYGVEQDRPTAAEVRTRLRAHDQRGPARGRRVHRDDARALGELAVRQSPARRTSGTSSAGRWRSPC